MKKVLCAIALFIFCCLYSDNAKNVKRTVTDLATANIECLAQDEGSLRKFCLGSGSLDCDGLKVKQIIKGCR